MIVNLPDETAALGWAALGTALPPPMQAMGAGPVQVIVAPRYLCATAQDRLALLQACFDHGANLVPLTCDHIWQIAPALGLAKTHARDIMAQLNLTHAAGQLTIALSWSMLNGPSQVQGDGRAWLQTRHLRHKTAAAQAQQAQQVISGLTLGLTGARRMDSTANRCTLNILIKCHAVTEAKAAIAQAARDMTASPDLPDLSLMITGLWPPFGFVSLAKPALLVIA